MRGYAEGGIEATTPALLPYLPLPTPSSVGTAGSERLLSL
jgi:hypothetical protein